MPGSGDEETPDKGTDSSSTSLSSQKIPVVALSKVAGVGPIELLINDVIDFNFDPSVSEDLIAVLQELVKIYISKGRDIKAGSREIIVEKVIAPFLRIFKNRETTNLSTIYDLKASLLDITERQYQSKIRSCEATIESLNGKLNILCSELNDYKKDFKESSRSLIETTKEVKSLVSRATPSFASIVTRPSVTKPPVITQRGNHVLLLRPKKESSSEENRKRVETALVSRNSPIRINRISKVSRGGLIIEAPNKDELQALERELACVTTIDEHFEVTRPKKRNPQIILIGVPRDVDKERLSKGLSAKNIFLNDSSNKPLFELNFSMKTRFASNWVMSIDPIIYKRLFDIDNLDKFIEIDNIELKHKILEFPSTIENSDFEVYTDGSGIDGNIGASLCIFNNNSCINTFQFKLSSFNSVFQAELAAINFAAGWAVDNGTRINIFTDSLSSIEALKKSNSKSKYLNEIKSNMFNAIGSVGLSWVKAHAGIPGNELADQYAKDAAANGNFLAMPAPYSFLKKFIKKYILDNWQQHWEDSKSGCRVREFVPKVDFNLLTHNRYLLFFISGHGPFPAYLYRFHIFESPNCVCGGLGDSDHFAFDCPLTSNFHFVKPLDSNKPLWFLNILKNKNSLARFEHICKISNKICDDLKM
ncbi:hypothetical protein AVEN_71903-1 [Araneus ventricosus]|uniref:ribonuclease H n=1 Tax=Araneus ventricosus TaxID=182803 RepID=A0A4Y2MR36_ARAVE|nr:hypothetical protein AVEN_140192-1 [Araneus ventricosus]GBN29642.1 hypothetical protein AVEN_71903-1 [Araneus ventricosus]